jgi:hypothetical protein
MWHKREKKNESSRIHQSSIFNTTDTIGKILMRQFQQLEKSQNKVAIDWRFIQG